MIFGCTQPPQRSSVLVLRWQNVPLCTKPSSGAASTLHSSDWGMHGLTGWPPLSRSGAVEILPKAVASGTLASPTGTIWSTSTSRNTVWDGCSCTPARPGPCIAETPTTRTNLTMVRIPASNLQPEFEHLAPAERECLSFRSRWHSRHRAKPSTSSRHRKHRPQR